MQNAKVKLLFLLIVTGTLVSACGGATTTTVQVTPPQTGNLDEQTGTEQNTSILEDENAEVPTSTGTTTPPVSTPVTTPAATSVYKDGSYSTTATYNSPGGTQNLGVTLSLKNDVIVSVSIQNLATVQICMMYENAFSQGISSVVVGKSLASLGSIGAVNGSSLTPHAFNSAVTAIKAQAKN